MKKRIMAALTFVLLFTAVSVYAVTPKELISKYNSYVFDVDELIRYEGLKAMPGVFPPVYKTRTDDSKVYVEVSIDKKGNVTLFGLSVSMLANKRDVFDKLGKLVERGAHAISAASDGLENPIESKYWIYTMISEATNNDEGVSRLEFDYGDLVFSRMEISGENIAILALYLK